MLAQQSTIRVNLHSLKYLFYQLKKAKNNEVIAEVYNRTYEHLFDYIHPKVSSAAETSIIVQEVYKIISTQPVEESEQNLLAFLERIADGCLVLENKDNSFRSTKPQIYA